MHECTGIYTFLFFTYTISVGIDVGDLYGYSYYHICLFQYIFVEFLRKREGDPVIQKTMQIH